MNVYLADSRTASPVARLLGVRRETPWGYECSGGDAVLRLVAPLFFLCARGWRPEAARRAPVARPLPAALEFPLEWELRETEGPGAPAMREAAASLLSRAAIAVIASSWTREGETLAQDALDGLGFAGVRVRLDTRSLEDTALAEAFRHPLPARAASKLLAAGRAGAKADWLLAVNLGRAAAAGAGVTEKPNGGLRPGTGRLLAPVLAEIERRDRELADGRRERRVTVTASIRHEAGIWRGTLAQADGVPPVLTPALANSAASRSRVGTGRVTAFSAAEKSLAPPALTDSACAEAAAKGLGPPLPKAARALAGLLERGLIERSAEGLRGERARARLAAAARLFPELRSAAERAEFGAPGDAGTQLLVPSGTGDMAGAGESEKAALLLVSKLFLARFLPPCRYRETRAAALFGRFGYEAAAREMLSPGWLELFPEARAALFPAVRLPAMAAGDPVKCFRTKAVMTDAPLCRHTEESLARSLASSAAGEMPAFASPGPLSAILRELGERSLAGVIETPTRRCFRCTKSGTAALAGLPPDFKTPLFTAWFERGLQEIEAGTLEPEAFLSRIRDYLARCAERAFRSPGSGAGTARPWVPFG